MAKRKKLLKRIALIALAAIVGIPLIIMPVTTAAIYEIIFSRRFDTLGWMEFELSEYPGLSREASFFELRGKTVAGYVYSFEGVSEPKGIVVVSHGFGGGGHINYLPFVNAFAQNGYLVFGYDAPGNDESEGTLCGFPGGIRVLDAALDHISACGEFDGLPVMLFGHSWGAYSAANVLNLHPEVSAAALISGINESEDVIGHYARQYAGSFADLTMPYVSFYERVKFGKEFADISGVSGLENTDALIFIAHSADDGTVPISCGYGIYEEAFGGDSRFTFVRYEDQGHMDILWSEDAERYTDGLNADFDVFVDSLDGRLTPEIKAEYMEENLDRVACFEPDGELVAAILEVYAAAEK